MGKRLLAALVLLAPAACWAAKAIPPSPRTYVHNEGVVSAGEESRLTSTLRGVETGTGHQFAVALFQSLDSENLDDYSNKVFRAWKIGGKKGNDGLLFCLYKNDRRWRVEVGYGLEGTLTDLEAAEIARAGIPFFKKGDFDGGVRAVVDGLKAKLEGQPAPKAPAEKDDFMDLIVTLIFAAVMLIWFFAQFNTVYSPTHLRGGGWSSGGGSWGSGSDWSSGGGGFSDGGGFSGGGGSSGGGGASGGW